MNIKETLPYMRIRKMYYLIKEWDKTKDNLTIAHSIKKYKNIHSKQVCVIVGNGPSLKADDLSLLYKMEIPTFACNRIHMIFPQTEWRPTYYFISDEKIISQYTDEIEGVPVDHRFFPKRFRSKIHNGVFYNELWFDYENEGKFSTDAAKGVYPAGSVTTEMIQFAYYMGFSEIYLIGVDFSYTINNVINSKSYIYQGENNYFVKGYLRQGEVADQPNIKANLLGYQAARDVIESQGRVIKNATRGGKLEVFDRADLDSLLEKWRKR